MKSQHRRIVAVWFALTPACVTPRDDSGPGAGSPSVDVNAPAPLDPGPGVRGGAPAIDAGGVGASRPDAAVDDGSRFTTFRLERPAVGITLGSDNALWLIENVPPAVVRMTAAGATTTFTLPSRDSHLNGMTRSADGNVWFTAYPGDRIGRVTPPGDIAEFGITPGGRPNRIAAASDGSLWFTQSNGTPGRITTSGMLSVPIASNDAFRFGQAIAAGLNGDMWIGGAQAISRLLLDGTLAATYTFPGVASDSFEVAGIGVGTDGNLWVADPAVKKVFLVGPSGAITALAPPPDTSPYSVVANRDGSAWVTLVGTSGGALARMTATGTITTFEVPDRDIPADLVVGPDGALFFTISGQAKVGRFQPP